MALPVLFVALCYIAAALAEAPCKLLNDGYKIPIMALGTGRGTAAPEVSNDEVRDAVRWGIEAGFRHVDTASVYGDEPEVGQGVDDAIKNGVVTREQMFVTTKLWSDKHKREQVVPALRESLKKLGMTYVDLYLVHFPVATKDDHSAENIDYLETWKGMEDARALGLTRSIGVSNFNISQIERICSNSQTWPAVNEVEVNPSLTQEPLVAYCQEKHIAVMAYSPFGFVVSRKVADAPPPRSDDPVLVALAQKYNKTATQIVLRYSIDRGLIPIPKSTNKARLAQNIDIFDFELTKEEIASINAFNKNVRVIDGKWFENFPYYPFESVEQYPNKQ